MPAAEVSGEAELNMTADYVQTCSIQYSPVVRAQD